MRCVIRALNRFRSDINGLSSIEFALAAASLAIAISAGILAFGLGIESGNPARYAVNDQPDPIVTGSIPASKSAPVEETHRSGCPDPQPVVILRR